MLLHHSKFILTAMENKRSADEKLSIGNRIKVGSQLEIKGRYKFGDKIILQYIWNMSLKLYAYDVKWVT